MPGSIMAPNSLHGAITIERMAFATCYTSRLNR
jgi:hypothetical protein